MSELPLPIHVPQLLHGLATQGNVYTAVTGDYDKQVSLGKSEPNVVYDLRRSPPDLPPGRPSVLWNREQKIVGAPPNGLWSVYLDGSLSPKATLREPVEKWLESADIALFKHPWRSCAYAEIDECARLGKVTADEAQKMRSHLMLAGFPKDFGLWACGMVARRVHANQIQIFAAPLWWELVQQVPRDQVWFPFVLWRLQHSLKRVFTIDADIYRSKWFNFRRHGS